MPTNLDQCRSCRASIFWATTAATGKLMPIDADPNPRGNIVLNEDGKAVVISKNLFEGGDSGRLVTYMSHFATCINARAHRKKK